MKKKIFTFVVLMVLVLTMSSCGNNKETKELVKAEITVKDKGVIKLELDPNVAPISVANFVKLADKGFYEGTTFHRIINNFMIQGGAPLNMYDAEETIKGEFSKNGVKNDMKHVRGVISMARADDMDSASSQFFIVHQDSPHLDGYYAAFGHVTEGMDIVDDLAENTPVIDNNGTVEKKNQPVIESVKIIRDEENFSEESN